MPVALFLIALILIDSFPNLGPLYGMESGPVDQWLGSKTGQGIVTVLPAYRMGRGEFYYYASFWNKPMLGGWFGPSLTIQGRKIQPVLKISQTPTAWLCFER